jgi:K+-transporting ATPase A subunit
MLRWLRPLEHGMYRLCGVRADAEMNWKQCAVAMLMFHVVGFVALYGLQRAQGLLPLNPAGMAAVTPDLSFNTAVSFITNTNWQSYGGETTLSYLTQMLGLTVQNFVSAAAGMAILVALIRGFVRRQTSAIGNYWVDVTRSTLYIFLPLSAVLALALVSQSVVQTLSVAGDLDCDKLTIVGLVILNVAMFGRGHRIAPVSTAAAGAPAGDVRRAFSLLFSRLSAWRDGRCERISVSHCHISTFVAAPP